MTVDELVYELRLDTSQFTDDQKHALDSFGKTQDAMEKRNKQLEQQNKNVGFSFQNVTYAAEGLFTALAGAGMASFARDTVNSVAATGRMATNIGESTAALSAFGRMIERNGGDAGAATGSLKGLTDQMTRLNTFGEGSPELFKFLGIIGGKQGDSPIETFMRFAEWAEKNKNNPQLVNIIGQSGGLDQGSINEALKGRTQVLKDYQEAQAGAVSPDQVEKLTALQKSWTVLDQAIEKTGRDIVTDVAPAFTQLFDNISTWTEKNQGLADGLGKVLAGIVAFGAVKPAMWVLRLLGLGALVDVPTAAFATGAAVVGAPALGVAIAMTPTTANAGEQNIYENGKLTEYGKRIIAQEQGGGVPSGPVTTGGAFTSQKDKEAFIRQAAIKAGINPDIAMRVARSEGFTDFLGDKGTSGGAFQLHVTPGGRGHAVGDEFQKLTGLSPLDKNNEHETIEFALEWAKRHGWSDYHGAARVGVGAKEGINIGDINIHTTSKDPKEHGKLVAQEVREQLGNKITTQANSGLN